MKKDEKPQLKLKIDIKGSLGLLAYGDIGLRAWRKVKKPNNKNEE